MAQKRNKVDPMDMPTVPQLERELKQLNYQSRYYSVMRSTIYILIVVAALAVLVATLWLPVLQIYGNSMTPTLQEGEIVLSNKTGEPERGDIVAFYYNNKILVKRVIAHAGEWVDIDENGYVFVNGERIDEPYVQDRAKGECDIELPYQVPDSRYFVIGDHRSVSVDSRSTTVGCIASEEIVGRLTFCVWPLDKLGWIK